MTKWSRRTLCIPLGFSFGVAFFVSALLLDYAELNGQGIPLKMNWGISCWVLLGSLATVVFASWPEGAMTAFLSAALVSCVAVIALPCITGTMSPWHPLTCTVLQIGFPVLSFVLALVARLALMGVGRVHTRHKMWLLAVIAAPIFCWVDWRFGAIYRLDTGSKEALYSVNRMVESALSVSADSDLPAPLRDIPAFKEQAAARYRMATVPHSFGNPSEGFFWGNAVNVFFDGGFSIGCAYCSSFIHFCQASLLDSVYWMLPPQR